MNTHRTLEGAARPRTLLDLLRPVWRGWRLVGAGLLLGAGLAAGGSFLVTPTFVSTTTFLPPSAGNAASALTSSLGALSGLLGAGGAVKSSAEQHIALMQSVTVSDRIIERFGLMDAYEAKMMMDARKRLASRVSMGVGKKDGLISVVVEDEDPKRAADIANAYVSELQYMGSRLAITEAQQRRQFFQRQLDESKERLVKAQVALQDSGFSEGSLKAEPKATAETYAKLRAELTSTEVRLQALRASLADTAPEVRQLSATASALRERLRGFERNEMPAPQMQRGDYISNYREYKYQEALFEFYAKQFEAARIDESKEASAPQVVDVATPAERRFAPRRSVMTALGGLAGLLLSVLLLIGRHELQRHRTP